MNDAYYEQLVTRKTRPADNILRILLILVIPVIVLVTTPFVGFFSFILAVIYGMIAYYFIFPRFNVEYEYDLLNHDLDIAAIYSKANRKKKLSIDIQQAEIIAPKGSPRLNSYHPDKTLDFSSGAPDAKVYAVMIPVDQKLNCIFIEPDRTMMEHIKGWMGMKLYQD